MRFSASVITRRSRFNYAFGPAAPAGIDRLGVATSFDVENSVVAPAMLIVADEMTCRVGREGRFAGAAPEQSDAGGSKELSFGVSPRSNTEGNTASRRLGSDRKD